MTTKRIRKYIRRIAKLWSIVIIGITLLILIGYAGNWGTTGKIDPYAMENYSPVENLIPITLGLSVLGLGIAWRWEGLGGAMAVIFHLATLATHCWALSPRPYPYPVTVAVAPPGILFLVSWALSRYAEEGNPS